LVPRRECILRNIGAIMRKSGKIFGLETKLLVLSVTYTLIQVSIQLKTRWGHPAFCFILEQLDGRERHATERTA
jgi:hypothetical protein